MSLTERLILPTSGTNVKRQVIAYLDERESYTFTFEGGVNISYVFPGWSICKMQGFMEGGGGGGPF